MKIPNHLDQSAGADAMMTPMIDVVFLLLIFFLCTASLKILEEVLPSSLVVSGSGAAEVEVRPEHLDLEHVVVKILWREGRPAWIVNKQERASLAEVREVLAAVARIDAELPVVVDPQPEVPLGHVIDVYDLSRLAGFSKVQFAAAL